VSSAFSSEQPVREDVRPNWSGGAESSEERTRASLSVLPLAPSVFAAERPVREDVQEGWSGSAECSGERARAQLPVASSAFSPERPVQEDLRENGESPTSSRAEQKNSADYAQRALVNVQLANDQRFNSRQVNEESLLPRWVAPPRVDPPLLAENGARFPKDEAKIPVEESLAPQPAKRNGSAASKRSAPNDLSVIARGASPSAAVPASSASRESRAAHGSNEFAAVVPHANPHGEEAKATRLRASFPALSSEFLESPVEVNVSVGSIDFRSPWLAPARKRSGPHPRVTLENYLKRGKRDGR